VDGKLFVLMSRALKGILLVHRYLGLALSLLFLIWFLSGFVMMYKDFPSITASEKLAFSEPIKCTDRVVQPHEAVALAHLPAKLQSIQVGTILQWPVYRLQDADGNLKTVFADNGKALSGLTPHHAVLVVKYFLGAETKIERVVTTKELDKWTPRTRFLQHMPLHKVYVNDGVGTVCYVSSATGEIIQKLNRGDKFWAWLGAIPHWIYFRDLRIHTQAWRDVVIGLSIFGVVMSLAGIGLGIVRTIKAKQLHDRLSPYKKKWFRWHHCLGFIFGVFVFTWILSGLFSMNPWKWSSDSALNEQELLQWQGVDISASDVTVSLEKSVANLSQYGELKELKLTYAAARPYWLASYANSNTKLLAANDSLAVPQDSLPKAALITLAQKLKVNQSIKETNWLTDYDDYYYNKHRTLPLPILRVKFSDALSTWYYINPSSAAVIKKVEQDSRLERWIYNGLHSLDFHVIFFRRPLWDVIVIVLLLGGTALSVTGTILSAKWIFRKAKKKIIGIKKQG